jgi:hypothetical protein
MYVYIYMFDIGHCLVLVRETQCPRNWIRLIHHEMKVETF